MVSTASWRGFAAHTQWYQPFSTSRIQRQWRDRMMSDALTAKTINCGHLSRGYLASIKLTMSIIWTRPYAAREKLTKDSIDQLNEKRAALSGKVSGEQKLLLREKERSVEERTRIAAEIDVQREQLDDVIAEIAMKRVRIRDLAQRLEEADELEERIKVLRTNKKSVSAELISEEIRLARFKENYRRTLSTYERNLKAQNKEHLAKSRKLAKIDEQINQAQEKRDRLQAENVELEKKKGDLNP